MSRRRIHQIMVFLLLLPTVLILPPPALAKKPLVAVAANFTTPMKKIIKLYKVETGVVVQATFSSTGKLYAQIKDGAPYDLFLAADVRRPKLLFEAGLATKPVVYARGKAELWTSRRDLSSLKNWQAVVTDPRVQHVAVSSPDVAPYGAAAITALKQTGLWPQVKDRLVYAQNVAQSFQFGQGGAADATFTALSMALSGPGQKGWHWSVPQAPLVVQDGCLVKNAKAGAQASKFFSFLLRNKKARAIVRAYGYE